MFVQFSNQKFHIFMFNNNLLSLNHWFINSNSEFTEENGCLCSEENKKDFYHLRT